MASATRMLSSTSSLKVSTRTMRGTLGSIHLSKARAARTVSPKIRIMAWGMVPLGARPASREPAGVEPVMQPPTMAA